VGGGLGGTAAALTAAQLGRAVILTEETDWIGGQLTAQGVPPDEHRFIEQIPCTGSYGALREGIRKYYRENYPLTREALNDPLLNPGGGDVSALCHEPRVAHAVLEEMLEPHRAAGLVETLLWHRPVEVASDGDRLAAVTLQDLSSGELRTISADYIVDATEFGDLLKLGEVEHIIGAESQAETGEPHALPGAADPLDQQAINWCFALEYCPGENHTIEKPASYGFWREFKPDFWPDKLFSWHDVNPITLGERYRALFETTEKINGLETSTFWLYRQIVAAERFTDDASIRSVTLVNWPQNNYFLGPLVGVSDEERAKHLQEAREQSLSFLYWMQTEAPRHDGGAGYPGLKLRGDVLGTTDGLAKAAYVQESRRIRAEFTVLEQHIGVEARPGLEGAELFSDTVGVGRYRMDVHPSTAMRTYIDLTAWPFQIPLGALIPQRVENLLPACKNIGTTHITNGCYRLHPVEWSIGVVAGGLGAFCLEKGKPPRAVRSEAPLLDEFQQVLMRDLDVTLLWPDEIRTQPTKPSWET